MRTLRLYGPAGVLFGREFTLDVRTPAEAIGALCTMLPAFKRWLLSYGGPGFHVRVGRVFRGEDDLGNPCGEREVIKLIPATVGSSAAARIVVGVVLVVVSYFFPVVAPYTLPMGISLIVGGVAELLAPKPKTNAGDAADRPRSYTFGNTLNTTGQGVAIPVGYGRMLVPSHVISAQVFSGEQRLDPDSPYVAPADVLGTDTGVIEHVEGSDSTDYGNWTAREYGGDGGGDSGGGDGDGDGGGDGGDGGGE